MAAAAAQKALAGLLKSLPALVAVAIVQADTGDTLAHHSTAGSLNPETAAAYNAEVVRQKQKALAALQLTTESIDDILISLTTQLHLIKLTADGSKFIYLVADARQTSLAMAREALRNSMEELE
ncbi:hypothetical protein FY528_07835 [Hymenobacter lutimineralis]|uniref:Roadblock/LC7 domain-containing protein n=2 Tax=Hymenobacteraceae TaxID=1853232 RepID=A0A5D6V884_9BACT|nr:hypothetical protein HER32_17665 [Hymenobacter sp. BT18]TYZ11039.1 hypothetical protein FY528_07835 [Hymenobacter lutimineralis]